METHKACGNIVNGLIWFVFHWTKYILDGPFCREVFVMIFIRLLSKWTRDNCVLLMNYEANEENQRPLLSGACYATIYTCVVVLTTYCIWNYSCRGNNALTTTALENFSVGFEYFNWNVPDFWVRKINVGPTIGDIFFLCKVNEAPLFGSP